MIKRISFFLVLVQTALSRLAWTGDLDTEFEELRSRIQDCEVSDEVKTYTLGFVDLAKSVIDVPGQLTFVSRKELGIVKCIVKFFYPLSEKKEGGMDVLNDMLGKLASQPNPIDLTSEGRTKLARSQILEVKVLVEFMGDDGAKCEDSIILRWLR